MDLYIIKNCFSLQHLSSFTLKTFQESQVPPQERLRQTKVQQSAFMSEFIT